MPYHDIVTLPELANSLTFYLQPNHFDIPHYNYLLELQVLNFI